MRVLRDVAAALDARLVLQIRWRAGDLDRLLDADHAQLSATVVRRLQADGWETRIEVTYADRGSSGSIDILAFHRATQTLLVIEVKTEVPSAEATLRKLDEKVRIAAAVARDRFGWLAKTVSELLVLQDTSTNRRRIAMHAPLFDSALPDSGTHVRRWLASPSGRLVGLLFLSPSTGSTVITRRGGRHRIRHGSGRAIRPGMNVARDELETDDASVRPGRTILVG